MERKIKDIYDISFELGNIPPQDRFPIHEWYNALVDKTYEQLDLSDVTRMVIQNTFLELSVPKALELLRDNPFCGERYEGELLELLSGLELLHLDKYKKEICSLILEAENKNITYSWLCEEERNEYFDLLRAFKAKVRDA